MFKKNSVTTMAEANNDLDMGSGATLFRKESDDTEVKTTKVEFNDSNVTNDSGLGDMSVLSDMGSPGVLTGTIKREIQTPASDINTILSQFMQCFKQEFAQANQKSEQNFDKVNQNFDQIKQELAQTNQSVGEIKVEFQKFKDDMGVELKRLNDKLQEQKQELQCAIDNVSKDCEKGVKDMSVNLGKHRVECDKRVSSVESRIEGVEAEMSDKISKNTEQVQWLNDEVTRLDANQQACLARVDAVCVDVGAVKKDLGQQIDTKVKSLLRGSSVPGIYPTGMQSEEVFVNISNFKNFSPNGKWHPVDFLDQFKNILPELWDDGRKIRFVTSHMDGEAGTWGMRVGQKCESFEVFQREFLRQYWSVRKQNEVRNGLYLHRRYDYERDKSLKIFFQEMYEKNLYLDEPISTEAMVSLVVCKLPIATQEKLLAIPKDDVEAIKSALSQLDTFAGNEERSETRNSGQNSNSNQHWNGRGRGFRGRGFRGGHGYRGGYNNNDHYRNAEASELTDAQRDVNSSHHAQHQSNEEN